MSALAINLLLFQLGWLACVLSAAAGRPWLGATIAVAILARHLYAARRPGAEAALLGIALGLGVVWDSWLVWRDWLTYPAGMLAPFAAPYWIVLMWALFASTINVSLRWLRGRPLWAAALGAVGGPAAYVAGRALGGVEIVEPLPALTALALGWAVFVPALVAAGARLDGFAPAGRPAWT